MHSKIHQICETKSKKNIKYSVQKRSKQYYTKNQSKLYTACSEWWERMDSNHRSRRQQIYSLPPLAARELSQTMRDKPESLSLFMELVIGTRNPRPADYKSAALPIELHQHIKFYPYPLGVKNHFI